MAGQLQDDCIRAFVALDRLVEALDAGQTKTDLQGAVSTLLTRLYHYDFNELPHVVTDDRAGRWVGNAP